MNQQPGDDDKLDLTPNPENPIPGPIPGPLPTPIPGSWPPDWWRCWRFGPVSGRFDGEMTAPTAGGYALDLRVDIDPRYANSPVMNRISGDIYRVYSFSWPGWPPIKWRVYQESWIVDTPTMTWSRCQVEITGAVRFWKGLHLITNIRVIIPWGTFRPTGPAEVTFTTVLGGTSSYNCTRKSDCFREMSLEVDVCQSVNAEPILPSYDTHVHATRPADLPRRTLTIEEAYRETGICVSIRPDRTIIDDSATEFDRWSVSELHDAMESHYSQFAGGWPKWQMWGLLAGKFDNLGTGGIMFDAAAGYGGAGEAPDRQGFAVFRDHSWFDDLVSGAPSNQSEAWAMRQFLYTWVHEAGHAFNFLHSWNKGRSNALSWMNYPQYVDNFWDNFEFRFDDEELIHIRHGDRASVIMGGDPWASGSHFEEAAGAFAQLEGNAPVEFMLRSKSYFEFMEPIFIELRLRNRLSDMPIGLDTRLGPEHGGVIVYIRRPDGRILEYNPILCQIGTPEMRVLLPFQEGVQGEDRYSEDIFLGYGKYGFYFDEPGEYQMRAVYQGSGDILIPSNVHRVRIGRPFTKEEDKIAQDFFSYQVGMSLYLNGSQSPFLSKGMEVLESVADRFKDTMVGAKTATMLANSVSRPFFRIVDRENPVLTQTHSAAPDKALALTASALELYKQEKSKSLNIGYHQLVRNRAGYMINQGQKAEAKKEVAELYKDLAERGVNKPVLDEIKTFQESI